MGKKKSTRYKSKRKNIRKGPMIPSKTRTGKKMTKKRLKKIWE